MATPTFHNFGEYFFWAYANFQMLFYAIREGKMEYDRECFMLRAKAYKAYREGRWKPRDLYSNNKAKMRSADQCWYCGKPFDSHNPMTLDHVFARSKGGDSAMDNLIPVCRACNSSKGDTDVLEWFFKRDLFPPTHIIAHYYKQIYLYAVEHALLDKHREDLKKMALPFNINYIIYDFPPPILFP